MRRHIGTLACTALLATTCCCASPLGEIEAWALQSADTLSQATLERALAEQTLQAAQGERGARWTLGASLGNYQEPVSAASVRSYGALQGVLGLRLPVLGSAEATERQLAQARSQVQRAELQQALAQQQLLRDVRLAYSSYVRSAQKRALAQAWLELEAPAAPVFLARTRAHALLEADRQALQSGFAVARRDRDRAQLALHAARAVLQRLSQHPLDALAAAPPVWPGACLQAETLQLQLAQRPAVALQAAALEAQERQSGLHRWAGVEGGITLQQSLVQELAGQSGQGTVLGVAVSVPLGAATVQRAQAKADALRLAQARLALATAQAEAAEGLEQALDTLQASASDLARSQQRLGQSLEADRIAMLRLGSLAGDVLEQALMARYALYQSAMDLVETRQRDDAARIELLAFGTGCVAVDAADDPAKAESPAELPALVGRSLTATLAPSAPPPDAGVTGAAAPAGTAAGAAVQAWFSWRGATLLGPALPALPGAPARLLVSFTPAQLAALHSEAATAQALQRHLQALHQRGWQVELLLGDASYVLPSGQAVLRQQLQDMAGFAFDGLTLDLERSDLAPAQQAAWWRRLLQTLGVAHAACAWPLGLATHFREFQDRSHQAALRQAGVRTLLPMVYVSDAAASRRIARRVLTRQAPLPVLVVQSVEPQLPAANSHYASGRATSLQHWQALAHSLSDLPNFRGIAVQSLEFFDAMPP